MNEQNLALLRLTLITMVESLAHWRSFAVRTSFAFGLLSSSRMMQYGVPVSSA